MARFDGFKFITRLFNRGPGKLGCLQLNFCHLGSTPRFTPFCCHLLVDILKVFPGINMYLSLIAVISKVYQVMV